MGTSTPSLKSVSAAVLALLFAGAVPGLAAVTLSPSAVSAKPEEATPVVGVTLTFAPTSSPGSGTLDVALPNPLVGHATVEPSPVTYEWGPGDGSATTSFRILLATTALPGTYMVGVTDVSRGAGGAALTLTVEPPGFAFEIDPAEVTLLPGDGGPISVRTLPEPGFSETVTHTLSGFPAFIGGGPVASGPPGYPDRDLVVSAASGATPGTYSGSVQASAPGSAPQSVPLTVVIGEAPGFTFGVSPNPLTLTVGGDGGAVTVETFPEAGFSEPVTYEPAGFPGFIEPGPPRTARPPGYPLQELRVSLSAGAVPGTYSGSVQATAPGSGPRIVPLTVVVREAPDFTFDVAPDPVTLPPGGDARVTVRTRADEGFARPVTYEPVDFPGFIDTGGSRTATAPAYADQVLRLALRPEAAPGSYRGAVRASVPGEAPREVPLTVIVGEPDLSFAVTPSPVELQVEGAAVPVTVTTTARDLELPITYAFRGLPAFIETGGPRTSAPPAFSAVTFPFSLGPGARPGTFDGVLEAEVPGLTPRRRPVQVRVLPPQPAIERLAPRAVPAGALDFPVRIHGRNFRPGARVLAGEAFVAVGAVRFLSPELLEVQVSARADAGGRLALLRVRNPDGATSPEPAPLAVVERSSLAAPFAVHTVAVLSPLAGAHVAEGETLHAWGVLGVSGTGTVVGSWLLDGVPFDRFVVHAVGGEPVEVRSRLPIPVSFRGQHRLQLAVESPQALVSEPVPLLQVTSRASTLAPWAPRDGHVVPRGERPLLRWSQTPGASGYAVEVLGEADRILLREMVGQARWRPSAGALARIGPGSVAWRVRPRFGNGSLGAPTEARRLVLLPERVELTVLPPTRDPASGRAVLRWDGGAPGLLYRVEFLDGDDGPVRSAALTAVPRYTLPRQLPVTARLRVVALGPGGDELGASPVTGWSPPAAGPSGGGLAFAAAPALPEVLERVPEDGSTVEGRRPRIAARWTGAVSPDEVVLVVDTSDVTGLAELTATSVVYRPPLALDPGPHRVTLWLGDEARRDWSFAIGGGEAVPGDETGSAPAEAADEVPPLEEPSGGDWRLDTEGNLSYGGSDALPEDETAGYAALSAALDLQGERGFAQATGDLSVRQDFAAGGSLEDENRSWVAGVGAPRREGGRVEAQAGYTEPPFLVGSELLTLGLPKGGVRGTAAARTLEASYYQTFDPELGGLASGAFGPEQEVRAASVGLPGSAGPFEIRAVGLDVEEGAGDFFFGGEGSLLGLMGSYRRPSGSRISFELARGEFEPGAGSLDPGGEGLAARVALTGRARGFDYGLRLRFTEEDFVNPANRGLTAGGIPDRAGGELSLGRHWDRGSFDIRYRHLEGGTGSGTRSPDARQDGGELSFSQRIGERVSLSFSSNLTSTRGDADEDLFLPAVDQTDWGARFALSETFGAFTLSQDLSFQESDDRNDPDRFSEVSQGGVSVSGAVKGGLSLFGQVTAVRNRSGAAAEETDSLIASLQPVWSLQRLGLSIQPYLSYNRIDGDLAPSATETESYRLTVSWDAPWLRSLLSLQVSGDWSRTRGPGLEDPDFVARYDAAFTVRWDWDGSRRSDPDPVFTGRPSPGAVSSTAGSLAALRSMPGGYRLLALW